MNVRKIISDGSPKGTLIGGVHLTLILAAYSSPFWLSWKLIALGVAIYWLQVIDFGGCLLNSPQYGHQGGYFYKHLLTALDISFNEKKLRFTLDWIIPLVILILALIIQRIF